MIICLQLIRASRKLSFFISCKSIILFSLQYFDNVIIHVLGNASVGVWNATGASGVTMVIHQVFWVSPAPPSNTLMKLVKSMLLFLGLFVEPMKLLLNIKPESMLVSTPVFLAVSTLNSCLSVVVSVHPFAARLLLVDFCELFMVKVLVARTRSRKVFDRWRVIHFVCCLQLQWIPFSMVIHHWMSPPYGNFIS